MNNLANIADLEINLSESDRSLLSYSEPSTATAAAPPSNSNSPSVTAPATAAATPFSDHESDPEDEEDDDIVAPLSQAHREPSVSFGSTRNIVTASLQKHTLAAAAAQAMPIDTPLAIASDGEDDYDYEEEYEQPAPPKKKSVLKNSKPGPIRHNRLSKTSNVYDLDGDGVLDPIEQAMRDRDVNGDGQLDNEEVHRIVQDQLKSKDDVRLYRKVAGGLLCLIAILAASNFGTSWASAILTRDTVAEAESGTIQSSETGEVMGFQNTAFTVELAEMTDEEFEERRALVEAEMIADPDHEDHHHRKLGKKRNNPCNCGKIAYDHGKIREKDLEGIIRRCDGINTVNVMRGWRDLYGEEDFDTTQICGPGSVVVKKGTRKKKNKKGTKQKYVSDQVTFRTRKGPKDKSLTFSCRKGDCYTSGGAILQGPGESCLVQRDYDGASECEEGLVCYRSDGETSGVGICTRLQEYARSTQVCQIDFGVNACEAGYACYETNGRKTRRSVGTVHTGNCNRVIKRSAHLEVCDVSYGADACVNGYVCLGVNGQEIRGNKGLGYCAERIGRTTPNNNNNRVGWYVDYEFHHCVRSCNNGPHCGGEAETWEETWDTAERCCDGHLSWMKRGDCIPDYAWSGRYDWDYYLD